MCLTAVSGLPSANAASHALCVRIKHWSCKHSSRCCRHPTNHNWVCVILSPFSCCFVALKMVLALKIHRFCIVLLNCHSFLKTVYVFGPHRSNEARKNTFPYQLIFLCFDSEVDSKARFRGHSHICVKSMQRFSIPIMIPEAFYTSSFSHLFLVSS